ncbi:MAG: sulfotransferase domain-containing protein [Shimia sp.]|uniref:sulfotransferase domain-containing protein n=1 Tax=Shimia sp. TaxID=1954381 RepID=UPI0040581E10
MAVERTLLNTQRNFSFLMRRQKPALMVSYEKLIMKPEETLADLADFLGVTQTQDQLAFALQSITPGRYKPTHEMKNSPNSAETEAAQEKERSWLLEEENMIEVSTGLKLLSA